MNKEERIQKRLDYLKQNGSLKQLRNFLEKCVKDYPDEYFFLSELTPVYNNLDMPDKALEVSKKAYLMASDDVWVKRKYCLALIGKEYSKEAIPLLDEILERPLEQIAYDEHGEGMRYAKSIKNDSRFLKGLALEQLGEFTKAKQCLEEHLANRRQGIYSDYTKAQVQKHIKSCEAGLERP